MEEEGKNQADTNEYPNGATVSNFDYSADNFLASMDSIKELCGLPIDDSFDENEIERVSSMITFLKEWKYFVYEPKTIKFSCEVEPGQVKDDFDGINLPQFSSANVPKMEKSPNETRYLDSDFLLHAGGLVWAMDWCPTNLEKSDSSIKCEYLAVAAHPPGSTYHKIGAPLSGRGIIQIWCLLSLEENVEFSSQRKRRTRTVRYDSEGNPMSAKGKRLGRPKKHKESCMNNVIGRLDTPPDKEVLTMQRPRRRPKGSYKKRPWSVENLNGQMESSPLSNNLILSEDMFIPLSSVDLEETALDRPVSAALHSKVENLKPQRRGRQRKRPALSVTEFVPVSENIVAEPVSADSDMMLNPSVPSYEPASVSENIEPDMNRTVESFLPKCRGRPRKKPFPSANECAQASVSSYEPASVSENIEPDMNRTVESFRSKRRRRPRKKPFPSANECAQASGDNLGNESIMAVPVSADLNTRLNLLIPSYEPVSVGKYIEPDMNRTVELSLPKRSRRPRKKPFPNADHCAQAFGVNLIHDIPTSKIPERSGNVKSLSSADDSNAKLGSACAECKEDSSLLSSSRVFGILPKNTSLSFASGGSVNQAKTPVPKRRGRPKKNLIASVTTDIETSDVENCDSVPVTYKTDANKQNELAITLVPENKDHCEGPMVLREETTEQKSQIPKDTAFPKIVFCLAHMGKVAWDVKWRPSNVNNSEGKHHLGYLAALLGNGSLEVWDVPLPGMVKILYTSSQSEGTDPRFLKLKPIFRCSKVKCGERQSIPLTVEWSPSAPHDIILAGCHDGTVALWKFSSQLSCQDVKPLLCFSADSVPIRSLAWAPYGSNTESANLIVTAGHEGLKFWDIRDPFRPLWEFNPVQRIILSIDWIKDPSCLIMSFDDGALRLLSLCNVANDISVTGEIVFPLKQPGLLTYPCSHFAIWSFQVSRASGLASYCTADGNACCFQLTTNAVEKDKYRYREPHFLCGSLAIDDKVLKIKSPTPNIPLPNIPFKKIQYCLGDVALHNLLSEANQARGANLPVSAFSGDDQTPVTKPGNNASDEVTTLSIENAQKTEEFPAKEVAMHKVRWNMNKGSQRWLCYGGAGGIIRCQTISPEAMRM